MSSAAFSLLHPGVQEAVFKRGWKELHSIQAQGIQAILRGSDHLLVCAHTAGGKTEAAFLPIISRLAENPRPSVQALYVGPLVALINDQFERLETLCADVEVPVHRWHGSASTTEKRRFRDSPGGILLITPESLESNFLNFSNQLRRIYADLDFVVIDELHSFLSNVRGVHLRSLLARLSAAVGRKPRLIGLSATLGDPKGARAFLAPDCPDTVSIIEGKGDQAVKFGIKAFLSRDQDDTANRWNPSAVLAMTASLTKQQVQQAKPLLKLHDSEGVIAAAAGDELDDIASDILSTCVQHTNLVFGNAKQGLEVLADRLHTRVSELRLPRDPFHVHHGSLSKEVRKDTEAVLKSGLPATVLCSSTLEMGIDIGSVRRVAQLDPPWSVASMRQRLGRSGRREGEPARMCLYSRDESPHSASSLTDLMFPSLVRAVALTRLMLAKWLEPHDGDRLHLSTLVHQILSCLRETGGMRATALLTVLVKDGAFGLVTETMFRRVLHSLGECELIEQMPTGELILTPQGERITSDRDFYAAFMSTEEFIVRHEGKEIGKLQSTLIPPIGENLILGGRRWCVSDINATAKTVFVTPAKGGKSPIFRSAGGEIHDRVIEEMRAVLADSDEPAYLDSAAQMLLKAARTIALRSGVLAVGYVAHEESIQWFPWLGTRGLRTLALHARCDGISAETDLLSITYKKTNLDRWRGHLESIRGGRHNALDLAQHMTVKIFEKFDAALEVDILDEANARDRLNLPLASARAAEALTVLNDHAGKNRSL
ncbi:MAG TPA: DEAD/DEAH box helicase [Verrucomicrobiae bacterium]|nr:DEAD/DEAH box helicase [Verrucomicrobiae bacterium]